MTHGSLFSGIGGFDLAAQWAGWENIFHCEWNEFGQRVLQYYWPEAASYGDITKTDFTIYRGRIDVLTGGFPCQPYSVAGKRLGKEDERHLWPEMLRAIREIKPRWVVGENVSGIISWNGGLVFNEVQTDLEAEGYEIQPFLIPACAVNAPHRRDRVWFVAFKNSLRDGCFQRQSEQEGAGNGKFRNIGTGDSNGFHISERATPNTDSNGMQRQSTNSGTSEKIGQGGARSEKIGNIADFRAWQNFPTQSPICGGNDGLPSELDGITFPKWRNESIKAYGNAIVPQVAYQIFKAINEYEKQINNL